VGKRRTLGERWDKKRGIGERAKGAGGGKRIKTERGKGHEWINRGREVPGGRRV